MENLYNYSDVVSWIDRKGAEIYGRKKFKIYDEDLDVIYRLIAYFLRDEAAAFQYGIDLEKGVMLAGPVGCGKSCIMNVMKYLAPVGHKFFVKPCRDISFEFIDDGYKVLHKYSTGKLQDAGPQIICFDDLGIENNLKYFGNDCNVMAEILLSRHDMYISKRLITHITSNLSASEIEKHYGLRVRSRLRQLVNLIAYSKYTIDKR